MARKGDIQGPLFGMKIDGENVHSPDQLEKHFTLEIIDHLRSGYLKRWLCYRKLTRILQDVEALPTGDYDTTLKELYRIFFQKDADEDAINEAIVKSKGGSTFQDGEGYPKLVMVPSGSFMMGSPACERGRYCDESPMHEVRIGYQFAVGVYPVTFDEWDACVSDGECGRDSSGVVESGDDEGYGRGNFPVINVTWKDAKTYVRWLSYKTGKFYRLLTESEWEYVARAGTQTPYWWGDEIGRDQANCDGCESSWDDLTAPVGTFSKNAFGLYNVHGNVHEWVEDCWNDSYAGGPTDGSAWGSENCDCEHRVLRGGCWSSRPKDLRSATRFHLDAGVKDQAIGFRVARIFTASNVYVLPRGVMG